MLTGMPPGSMHRRRRRCCSIAVALATQANKTANEITRELCRSVAEGVSDRNDTADSILRQLPTERSQLIVRQRLHLCHLHRICKCGRGSRSDARAAALQGRCVLAERTWNETTADARGSTITSAAHANKTI